MARRTSLLLLVSPAISLNTLAKAAYSSRISGFVIPCHHCPTFGRDAQRISPTTKNKTSRRKLNVWSRSMARRDQLPEDKDADDQGDNVENVDSLTEPRGLFQQAFGPWNVSEIPVVEDKQLIAGDLLSLLVVALLVGFNDAVSDPNFLPNGGFGAPIPPVPATMGTATTRFTEMGLAWIVSSLYNRGYTYSAVESDQSALKSSIAIWVSHCSIRIVLALVVAALHHAPVDALDILKQLWFTLPLMTAFRIAYGRQNSSSTFM